MDIDTSNDIKSMENNKIKALICKNLDNKFENIINVNLNKLNTLILIKL